HVSADLGRALEALDLAVVWIGEPYGPIALHHDVVWGVEVKSPPVINHRLNCAASQVHAADPRRGSLIALLADHEPSLTVERHAIRHVRGNLNGFGRPSCERKLFAS